jgi:hypothetical protein
MTKQLCKGKLNEHEFVLVFLHLIILLPVFPVYSSIIMYCIFKISIMNNGINDLVQHASLCTKIKSIFLSHVHL